MSIILLQYQPCKFFTLTRRRERMFNRVTILSPYVETPNVSGEALPRRG